MTTKQVKKDIQNRLHEDPTMLYRTTFQHIYFTSGFTISKELTQDGKQYNPPKNHACLRCGYWCLQNAKERPRDLISYVTRPIRLLTYRLKTRIFRRFIDNKEDL